MSVESGSYPKDTKLTSGQKQHLDDLYSRSLEGDTSALDDLSKKALGGYGYAQELIKKFDSLGVHKVTKPGLNENVGLKKTGKFQNALFVITHPVEAVRVKVRQIAVGADLELPPSGTTIEKYPNLTVKDAALIVRGAKRRDGSFSTAFGGVPQEAWPGGHPELGKHPEHPNI